MKTGRPARPIEERKQDGTLRSHHARTPVVSGRRMKPKCPPELANTKAALIFDEIVRELWPAQILDRCDTMMVATAALHLATAFEAQDKVATLGTVYPVTRGAYNGNPGYKVLEANPAVKIVRDSLTEFRQCCDALGVGPTARARLANMGMKGATPAHALPGVGAAPTPLHVIEGGASEKKASPKKRAPTTKAPTTKAPTTKAPTTKAPTTKAGAGGRA